MMDLLNGQDSQTYEMILRGLRAHSVRLRGGGGRGRVMVAEWHGGYSA